jgi:HSP20 family protein
MSALTLRNRNNNYGLSLFDDVFSTWGDIFSTRSFTEIRDNHSPMVKDLDDRIEISLAAPGVEKKDFIITVEGDKLTLAYNAGDKTNHYAFAANYTKSYTLPNYSDVENISASYKNGVLVVAVPKTEAATARVIKVK